MTEINLERSWECGRCRRRMEKPGRHLRPGSFVPCFEEMRAMKTFSDPQEYALNSIRWDEKTGNLPAPHIKVNHVDGPCIVFSDGQVHWLSLWDQLILALGLTDAELLQFKHRPNLVAAFGIKLAIPRVKFYFGPDFYTMDRRTRVGVMWGKTYTAYDKYSEGLLVYKHMVAVSWPQLLKFEWH